MEKKTLALIAWFGCAISIAFAQQDKKTLVDGNKLYSDSAFMKASELYQSVDANSEYKGRANFNAANALYRADSLEKSIELLQNQAQLFSDNAEKAKSYHNLGNAYLKTGKLQEAVDAFKEALKNNPSDDDTRYNYTKAKKLLQQQKQEEKPEDKKDDKKEENKEQEEQQENEKQDEKQEEDKGQDEKKEQEEQQQQEQEQQQKQQQAAASKKQAEQMLNALNQEEKGIQKKVKKQQGKGEKIKIEKDW